MHTRHSCLGWSLLVMAFFLFPTSLWAAASVSRFGPKKVVTIEDFKPHLMSDEMYTEQWSYNVWQEDGVYISIDAVISNLGIGDHKMGLKAAYKESNKLKAECKFEYSRDEWNYNRQGFSLTMGKNSLKGDLNGLDATIRCDQLSLELHFQNEAMPAFPGDGKLRFDQDDGIYGMVFTSPRSLVTGKATYGGSSREVKGYGFVEQSYSNMAPYEQVHRWFRFKAVDKNISIILQELESTQKYGSDQRGWAVISDSTGPIAITTRVGYQYEGFIQDTRSEEGYQIPRKVTIAVEDGENQVTGWLLMKDIREIKDPTADLDGIRKAIVSRLMKPRDYYINCSYRFSIKKGNDIQTVEGKGMYRFMYVNP